MNIKKNSLMVLGLVFGVSVILYIFDVPITPQTIQLIPTIAVPTVIPTITTIQTPQAQNDTALSNVKKYSAMVTYDPEGRSESINVSLTLNNTTITEISSQHSMNDGKSRRYQMNFESAIGPLVIGKDINTLNLSRVAGASFTTDAFMQAIQNIKSKI
jgi:hypothetical protein